MKRILWINWVLLLELIFASESVADYLLVNRNQVPKEDKMIFGKVFEKLKFNKGQATELGKKAADSVGQMLNEMKEALSIFENLGFQAEKVKIGGIGVALPDLSTSLHASVGNIQIEKARELSEQHKDNKLIVLMIDALIKVKEISDRVEIDNLKGVKMDVKLGAFPKISVDLQSN